MSPCCASTALPKLGRSTCSLSPKRPDCCPEAPYAVPIYAGVKVPATTRSDEARRFTPPPKHTSARIRADSAPTLPSSPDGPGGRNARSTSIRQRLPLAGWAPWPKPLPYAHSQNNGQMTRLASADSTGSRASSTNISGSHEVSRVWGTHGAGKVRLRRRSPASTVPTGPPPGVPAGPDLSRPAPWTGPGTGPRSCRRAR
jgi:hypothetical protein